MTDSGDGVRGCTPRGSFTVLSVAENELRAVSVVVSVDAPGLSLPTDHGGLFRTRVHAPLRSP